MPKLETGPRSVKVPEVPNAVINRKGTEKYGTHLTLLKGGKRAESPVITLRPNNEIVLGKTPRETLTTSSLDVRSLHTDTINASRDSGQPACDPIFTSPKDPVCTGNILNCPG